MDSTSYTTSTDQPVADPHIVVQELTLRYGDKVALTQINMALPRHRVTAIIGPSGCGKSTLLRCFNRMNDLIPEVSTEGEILLDGSNVLDEDYEVMQLRRNAGMVFQRPNPFPKSIYDNVAYGLRLSGKMPRSEMDDRVEWALRGAALWDDVADRLKESALRLSGGQQQRLVIARAIALKPEVLLLDEPASALDPISTLKLEELIDELSEKHTIIIVTHNMQQAARVSHRTAFMYLGKLVEYRNTEEFFTRPKTVEAENYVSGRYG